MSRRCAREGVAWHRRADVGEDIICDPLERRPQTRMWWGDDAMEVVRIHHDAVMVHLRERPAPLLVIVDDGPREWTREQHEAMEARLAQLESFVARCIVGAPGTENLVAPERSRVLADLHQRVARGV